LTVQFNQSINQSVDSFNAVSVVHMKTIQETGTDRQTNRQKYTSNNRGLSTNVIKQKKTEKNC